MGVAKSAGPIRSQRESLTPCSEACAEREDLLHRFTATPYATNLRVMQRTVRLETNTSVVQTLAANFFGRHEYGRTGEPEFLWRVVCESGPRVKTTAVQFSAFSSPGLQYVNIGQRGFMGVDLDGREAVGFLDEISLEGELPLRHCRSFDVLFSMTAPSLGLTGLSGGCVGMEDRGIVIFGPPNSGKTTACYLAAKLGMEFHADQAVFLDTSHGPLRAWGDLLPAVFRPETLDFLPELRPSTRRSSYGDLSFYYLDKSAFQQRRALPVTPVCSLFLDRSSTSEPKLREILAEDAASRLRDCILYSDDARFDEQIATALRTLAAKPTFHLQYGSDPKVAASYIEKLLQQF
jgi:hypothetical protein